MLPQRLLAPGNRTVRYAVVALFFTLYVGVFTWFHEDIGMVITALAVIPVVAGSWYFGIRGGILTTVISILASAASLLSFDHSVKTLFAGTGYLVGNFILLLIAVIVGRMATLLREKIDAEIALLRRDSILRAVSAVSELFLKTSLWEKNINTALEQLGRAADASRVYIFERHFSEQGVSLVSQRHEWAAQGISPQIENPALQNLAWREAGFARWEDTLERRQSIAGRVRDFPDSEKELLAAQGILAIAVMPIFTEDKLWGFIGFDECRGERLWTDSELDALHTAADIFSAALVRQNIQASLLKRQQTLNLLQEILHTALSKNDLHEMAQFLVDHLGFLIGADNCYLTLWDDERQKTIPLAAYGAMRDTYHRIEFPPGERTLTQSALEAGHTLIIENVKTSPLVARRITELFPTVAMIVVPMIADGKRLGAVLLGSTQPRRFTPDEIIISEQAANLVALAIAKLQAMEQARRRAEEAETLRKAGAAVAETLDIREATARILQQLALVLPYDSASVQLLRDGELEIIGGEGFKAPVLGIRFPVPGNNPNSVVLRTRKPYILHEANKHFEAFNHPPHDHIRSWLGVPLIVREQLIGLLAIDSVEPFHFTSANIELVSAFADQVAVAIENARLFDETQRLAITDGLTGLYNRRHFMEIARREFERARRYKRPLSAMIFDVDHFKAVNDTYGHAAGDEVLRAIAKLCREEVREADPLGRYGGEEFVGLFVESGAEIAQKVADRLRKGVEKLVIPVGEHSLQVTVSIGIAEQNHFTPNLESLLARADQAMYIAKHRGRNRVAVSF
ncbi:MAG: diguanylate cyclase [Chloroflexi bacterium]|nr:diguanylate cyclase [Chloroflexota bacterium]